MPSACRQKSCAPIAGTGRDRRQKGKGSSLSLNCSLNYNLNYSLNCSLNYNLNYSLNYSLSLPQLQPQSSSIFTFAQSFIETPGITPLYKAMRA